MEGAPFRMGMPLQEGPVTKKHNLNKNCPSEAYGKTSHLNIILTAKELGSHLDIIKIAEILGTPLEV
jgi:hypothetical protein